MRLSIVLLLLVGTLSSRAQINNWDPTWYTTDSALIFHDDLDFYLNGYSKKEIKKMRKQVNIFRMNFDKSIRRTIDDLRAYSEGNSMQPVMHDFTLPKAQDGVRYTLSRDTGRIRAFMFGSLTNPPSRMQLPRWEALVQKYDTAQVKLFVIYGKELHPGDKKWKDYPDPKSEYEKMAYAQEYAQLTSMPVYVDGLNNKVYEDHGKAPNTCVIIDADNNLVFRGTWADSRKVEYIIDTLLKWYRLGRPKDYNAENATRMQVPAR